MKKTEEQRPDITMMMDITRLSLREGKNQHPQRTGMIIQRNLKTEVPNTAAKAEKGKDVEEESENTNSKRFLHLHVHSNIYNSQDMEAT